MTDADSEPDDFTALDDPGFLAERARVRAELEHARETAADPAELESLFERMNAEFDSRARKSWQATA
jgi:hypothetical protein